MRRPLLALVALVATAGADSLTQGEQNTLTPIDSVPTPNEISSQFPDPANQLASIASDSTQDIGIRLRAIHALVHYCSPCSTTDAPHAALAALISTNAGAQSGSSLLLLRAAIEAIGPLQVSTDLDLLVPLLDHRSRDIRAVTALGLRALGDNAAVCPLRVALQSEAIVQVRLAISDALRVLGAPPQPCT